MISNLTPFFACAVCGGSPDSLMTKGVIWGVVSLLCVVVGVLGSIAYTAFTWAHRANLSHSDKTSPS